MDEYTLNLKSFQVGLPAKLLEYRKTKYLINNFNGKSYKKKEVNVAATVKRFKYLLEISTLFKQFLDRKVDSGDEQYKQVLSNLSHENPSLLSNKLKNGGTKGFTHRSRLSEHDEDKELLKEETKETKEQDYEDDVDDEIIFTESPLYINGKLRPYQIQGLNWLVSLHRHNLSGILADEMGLGKTLQTISFLGYIRYLEKKPGPFLIIAPKSTLNNWLREFNKWTPDVDAFILQGDKEQRQNLVQDRLLACKFDVVISSYEIVIKEKATFRKFNWEYIVIDEAHRIKNEESMLSQVIREFTSKNRLLITGTPLQNNLHELWALLNFLLPDIFADSTAFDEWFGGNANESVDGNEKTAADQDKIVKQLHAILSPFLLRRVKSDVEKSLLPKKELNLYVGMSRMQKSWYRRILERDIDAVNGNSGKKETKTRLLNIMMQLRKCCNHPYLFDGAEPGPPFTTDQHLIDNCAKLKVLDKLLEKFQKEGSRILIFSQMSRLLDILEDYCYFKNYEYCRIDGSTAHEDRIEAIDEYNAPGSKKFIFLLTTRAGGLGINLTSADIVVLYDSDWNPQADLQAMDRAHRIGQKKQVKVFRFVTSNSVEEKILERATQKLRLDQLVIQQGRTTFEKRKTSGENKDDLLSMIQFGARDVFNNATTGESADVDDEDGEQFSLDELLAESEKKTRALNEKYSNLGLDDLQKFSHQVDDSYEWNGKSFQKKAADTNIIDPLTLFNENGVSSRRERNTNYSIDEYYRDVLNPKNNASTPKPPSQHKMPRPANLPNHQLLPPKLKLLLERERLWTSKINNCVPTVDDLKLTYSCNEFQEQDEKAKLKILQNAIENAQPLSVQELAEKERLKSMGFITWNKIEFRKFLAASGRHGRCSIKAIAKELEQTKTEEEVREYSNSFWNNINRIDNFEKIVKNIEAEEDKIKRTQLQQEALRRKLSQYKNPLKDMKITYPSSSAPSKRMYSLDQDRFLLIMSFKHGLNTPNASSLIKKEISESPLFLMDYFFQSRTASEIARRCQVLLQYTEKEFDTELTMTDDLKSRIVNEDLEYSRKTKKIKK
ncbi:chromatin-remodeling ATPase ISW1 SCDLUD_001037 [Saccharomycodes ludwigii]|uniref:chromatin-remodeling ATPase ISW1 n=1 Tax=Saccharomycodes ludwigii TaxID=36035 RepID=UPI001E8B6D70|nr:hypothetical protein SCDLUD_001037 [Saccharomycodes ludwigii]KAH3903402.1 hypothetical protein SCDLUD_001037 [Saccharomycodes ludwigii]